jgi:acylphosphatase
MADEQRIVHFSGTVQGVGFRYTTVHVARGYDVTGTVRNLPDGKVQCVVEGESAEIDAFLAEVDSRMGGYIRNRTEQKAPHSGRFPDFTVAF